MSAPKKIRVLRLLEYTYDSVELMVFDMGKWGVQGSRTATPIGTMRGTITIKSTVLPPEILEEDAT